jgi:N-terminal domain of galactosyltransferase/N-terminal region of glycosyl transferase group 7
VPSAGEWVRRNVQPLLQAATRESAGGRESGEGPTYRRGRWEGLSMARGALERDVERMCAIVAESVQRAWAASDGSGAGASLCVVVPYRAQKEQNRALQLERFVRELPPILERVGAGGRLRRWHVLIAEQSDDGFKFNRGKLLNAGILLARRDALGTSEGGVRRLGNAPAGAPPFNAFCLHDVDLLPRAREVQDLYAVVPALPVHPGFAWNRYAYDRYCGGIVTLGDVHVDRSGAFPNDFWGWGGEDDVLSLRLQKVGFPARTYLRPALRGDGKSGAASLVEDMEETVRALVGGGVRASEGDSSRFVNDFKSEQIRAAVLQAADGKNCIDDCTFRVDAVTHLLPTVTKITLHLFPERDPHAQRLQDAKHALPDDLQKFQRRP